MRARSLIAVVALLGACANDEGPDPVATALIPDHVANDRAQMIEVEGRNFFVRIRARFDEPGSSEVRGTFRVKLAPRAAGMAVELDATRSTDSQLHFTLPAGFIPGAYDLSVTDLFARTTPPIQLMVEAVQGDGGLGGGTGGGGGAGGGGMDGGMDGGPDDAGVNAGSSDAGSDDAGSSDGGSDDAGTLDAGTDAGLVDAGADAGSVDAGTDAGANDAGLDGGALLDAGNTPPLACLRATPRSAVAGTSIQFDAFCSSDPDQPSGSLTVRFTFGDGDGGYSAFVPNTGTVVHSYPDAGTWLARVQVLDDTGLFGFASLNIHSVLPTAGLVVTTGIDELDANANPGMPGGTGLSLREAITFVINNPSYPRAIRIGSGVDTLVTRGAMPPLPDDLVIAGNDELVDFNGTSPSVGSGCLVLGTRSRLLGLRVTNCGSNTVRLGGTAAQLSDCEISAGPLGGAPGVLVTGPSALVTRNDISGFYGIGLFLQAPNGRVSGNRIHDNRSGVNATGGSDGLRFERNFVYRNSIDGFYASGSITPAHQIWLNTFDLNASTGLNSTSATIDLQDNLFTRTGGTAVSGSAFTVRSPNGFFSNGSHFSNGNPTTGFFVGDPLYRNPDAGDYRLGTSSPMRDKGVDLGIDLNGPEPSNFNGAAVDLGADEAP